MSQQKIFSVLIGFVFLTGQSVYSQDTFSIVAVDTTTGEVGSAGASCVDLFQTTLNNDDFLGQLIPNVGAINTQAYYLPTNQNNATDRMNLGETPDQIIQWLVDNDVNSQPELRQYGIAAIIDGSAEAAAHTGSSTDDYKNHIVGPNYAIQGNILLGQAVLDSMEARFLNEPGDLACKLMAALQGANMVGADTRCNSNGTSSLFAFVKVAQPTDAFGSPSFKVSVRTHDMDGIEPIDTLQTKFDLVHVCEPLSIPETEYVEDLFYVYPNPVKNQLIIESSTNEKYNLHLTDKAGRLIFTGNLYKKKEIDLFEVKSGVYFLKISNTQTTRVQKLIVE